MARHSLSCYEILQAVRLTYFCLWFTHYILGKSGTKASQQKINWKDVPLHIRSCYILCLPSNAGLDLRIRDFLTFFAGSFHTLGLFTTILCRFQTNLQCKHSGLRWIVVLVRPRMVERRERVIKWAGVHFCETKKQDIVEMRAALVLLVMIVRLGDAQRRVIGDNQEQRISQVRNYKRPCIYFQKSRPMREDTALIWNILTTSKQTLTSEKRGFTDGHPPTLSLPARLLDLLQSIRWVHLL